MARTVQYLKAARALTRHLSGRQVRPAVESGVPVLQVFGEGPVPAVWQGLPVVPRHPGFVPDSHLDRYGPVNHLAQSWTPPSIARKVLRALVDAGFDPRRYPVVHDLAAGHGRLVEALSAHVRLVLNELEPGMARLLRKRFPPPHAVLQQDFRTLAPAQIGTLRCLVMSPPWIDDPSTGEWLPTQAVELAGHWLQPGGLAVFLLPDWMSPRTHLKHAGTYRLDDEDHEHAANDWNQRAQIVVYRR